jgi:hypothetical protein
MKEARFVRRAVGVHSGVEDIFGRCTDDLNETLTDWSLQIGSEDPGAAQCAEVR